MKPTLAVIHIDIAAGADELAREHLLEHLQAYHNPCLSVLWVNWIRERADLHVVCLVHDLDLFDEFLINTIRTAPGVRGTSAQLAFDGTVRSDAMMDVSMLNSGWTAARLPWCRSSSSRAGTMKVMRRSASCRRTNRSTWSGSSSCSTQRKRTC